ncbi:MAG TPA: alanine racemase, partial [Gemmatales bacterium]|nr:alanine racemase [Gemmatales bacterium]
MNSFALRDASEVPSPSLLLGWSAIQNNLQRMLSIAGSPERLRPHMKTHKTRDITELYLNAGITRHKCATLREAEVLADCGVPDILIAFPLVGPNQKRLCELAKRFPQTRFSCLGDDDEGLSQLNQLATDTGVRLGFFLAYNVGQNRTGMQEMPNWMAKVIQWKHLRLCGMHLYDGHNQAPAQEERRSLAQRTYQRAIQLGLDQPGQSLEYVLGGTPA